MRGAPLADRPLFRKESTMKKITVSTPVTVAQSTTEPVLFGGYQLPHIRMDEKKKLYLQFMGRKDSVETYGEEEKDLYYLSRDAGETWERTNRTAWEGAAKKLPNGDILSFRQHTPVRDLPPLPPTDRVTTVFGERRIYTVEELTPLLGDRVEKEFKAVRIPAGETEPQEENCHVHWKNMPVTYIPAAGMLVRTMMHMDNLTADKNGVLWATVYGFGVDGDGRLLSPFHAVHLLRSEDMGHNWHYVSTVPYKEEYNRPTHPACVEGFNEAAILLPDDGSIVLVLRTGSLHPRQIGEDAHPAPMLYIVRSADGGKSWEDVKPFYDFGVFPVAVRLGDTFLLSSGRPGVYLRTADAATAKEWSEPHFLVKVPKEDFYSAYFEYSCSNTDLVVYDEHTAFIAYSDFKQPAPDGTPAKSIMVAKITLS